MKEHVAIFLPDLSGGGAERSMVNLAAGLQDLGCRVDLVLVQARGPFLSNVAPGIRVVDLNARHPMLSLPALSRYLRTEKPVALLAALNQANVVAAWSKRLARHETRIAVSIRNTLSAEARQGSSLNVRFMPYFAKRYFPWADEIIAVSRGAADDFVRMSGVSRDRVSVVYNPVVSEELLEQAKSDVDHPWFAPGQPPVVLAVGRLNAQKDYATLLHAFARVRGRRAARLVILGEGELRDSLTALAKELAIDADFDLPGFQSNPFAFMARAAVFVLSSQYEGLPGVLIQALACGTPVVSTDCPSGPREVLANGEYGALVPVGDVDGIADGIDSVLDRRARRIDLTPPRESWAPFRVATATRQYAEILLGSRFAPVEATPERELNPI